MEEGARGGYDFIGVNELALVPSHSSFTLVDFVNETCLATKRNPR